MTEILAGHIDHYPLRSAEIEKLALALSKAQGEFPQVIKNKVAKIPGKDGRTGYEYGYADLAAVREAVTPALSKNELAVIQQIDCTKNWLITTLVHSSGQFLCSTFQLPSGLTAQQFGSQLTYARRYCFSSLVFVAGDEEDEDGTAAERATAKQKRQANIAPALIPNSTKPQPNGTMQQVQSRLPIGLTREAIMAKISDAWPALMKLEPNLDLAAEMYSKYGKQHKKDLNDGEAYDLARWMEQKLLKGVAQ